VKAHPDNARFAYQLGRVYYYSGDYEKGISYISRSADMGYRQGEFVMGAIVDNRRPGVTYDICAVEDYWYRSAVQGHLHARVAYVRHLTKGRFDQCTVQASNEQVVEMIDITAKGSSKYFLRLLVEDLKEDMAAYLQDK
jgi:TPR repeat protein